MTLYAPPCPGEALRRVTLVNTMILTLGYFLFTDIPEINITEAKPEV